MSTETERAKERLRDLREHMPGENEGLYHFGAYLAERMGERITRKSRNKWGLYIASEKIPYWQSTLGMANYLGVDALAAKIGVDRAAMVDSMAIELPEMVYVELDKRHPYHRIKSEKFQGKPEIKYGEGHYAN